jgi:hypothetical protein
LSYPCPCGLSGAPVVRTDPTNEIIGVVVGKEKACFYKARMNARVVGEVERLEDQCKRDVELKRLRKAVEKLNWQNQR